METPLKRESYHSLVLVSFSISRQNLFTTVDSLLVVTEVGQSTMGNMQHVTKILHDQTISLNLIYGKSKG